MDNPMQHIKELNNVIDLKEEIGIGSYGVVKAVSVHGMVCAAKDVHKILLQNVSRQESAAVKQRFLQECANCSKLLHPNIVQFLGIFYPEDHAELPLLVMEKLDCSLTGYVEAHKHDEIFFLTKASIFKDVLLGLQYLHAENFIHRDLSSNNVLLTKFLVAKIADLGMAKLTDPTVLKTQSKQPGTPIFMPPEALKSNKYSSSIDVFSFGCVMVHLMAQELPMPEPETYFDVKTGKKVALLEVDRRMKYLDKIKRPPQLKNLISECLDDNALNRPSVGNLLEYFEMFLKQQGTCGIYLDKDQQINKLQQANEQLKESQKKLLVEVHGLRYANENLSQEVGRLLDVDRKLTKAEEQIMLMQRKADEEMATQKFLHQQQDMWQKEQQLQHYQMNQQPQNNLQLKGRGRGMFPNQPIRPVGDTYGGGAQYPQKHLPPPAPDHFGGQPMPLGSRQRDLYHAAETYIPPMPLVSFRSKQQTPLVSEGINEEIRYQADLQRKQPSEEFESGIAYDPYLICPKCKRQFREGQIPEYRHHIDNCRHQQ